MCSATRARCRMQGVLHPITGMAPHVFPLGLHTCAVSLPQLPVYVPSEAEKKDPALYASNVRDMMLRVGGFKASPASLQDSRAYIALLQARHRERDEHGCVSSSAALHASPHLQEPPAHQLWHMVTCRLIPRCSCLYRLS